MKRLKQSMEVASDVVLNETINEVMEDISDEIGPKILKNNRDTAFRAICNNIKPFKFAYTDGELSVYDNAKSLQYISILANNVNVFADQELKKYSEGDYMYDSVNSLAQKAKKINRDILPSLDINLVNAVSNDAYLSGNINEFVQNIENTLNEIQGQLQETLQAFPLDNELLQNQLKMNKEATKNEIEKLQENQRIERELFNVEQNVSKDEWDRTSEYVDLNMKGTFGAIDSVAGNVLNATASATNQIFNQTGEVLVNAGKTMDNILVYGLGPVITSLIWTGAPVLAIAAVIYLMLICSPVFKVMMKVKARRIEKNLQKQEEQNSLVKDSNMGDNASSKKRICKHTARLGNNYR